MAPWRAFEAADPELGAEARRLLERTGIGEGLLATVRGDGLPRIHPVYVKVVDGQLLTAALAGSAKLHDLARDGRYALHAHQDPAVPHELLLRGRARAVDDVAQRAAAADAWPFTVADGDGLFALDIQQVVLGERPDPDAWPPRYRSWRDGDA